MPFSVSEVDKDFDSEWKILVTYKPDDSDKVLNAMESRRDKLKAASNSRKGYDFFGSNIGFPHELSRLKWLLMVSDFI